MPELGKASGVFASRSRQRRLSGAADLRLQVLRGLGHRGEGSEGEQTGNLKMAPITRQGN